MRPHPQPGRRPGTWWRARRSTSAAAIAPAVPAATAFAAATDERDEAAKVVAAARAMAAQPAAPFKVSYAANIMPVRLAVESGDWDAAARLQPLPDTPPKVAASVHWARALGHARAWFRLRCGRQWRGIAKPPYRADGGSEQVGVVVFV